MMSSPTLLYDVSDMAHVAEILTHHIDALEFVSRGGGRYSLTLGAGVLDPARSGNAGRWYRW
jgi:hypothetical protein